MEFTGGDNDNSLIYAANSYTGQTLAISDYLRDLQDRAPSGFSRLQQDKPDADKTVSQLRRKRPLGTEWHNRRAKATGLTAQFMDEIASRRAGN